MKLLPNYAPEKLTPTEAQIFLALWPLVPALAQALTAKALEDAVHDVFMLMYDSHLGPLFAAKLDETVAECRSLERTERMLVDFYAARRKLEALK